MKWTWKLITEFDSCQRKVREVASSEGTSAFIKPASLGMSVEESRQMPTSTQAPIVSDRVDRHIKAQSWLAEDPAGVEAQAFAAGEKLTPQGVLY